MRTTTRLRQLLDAPEVLSLAGAHNALSARLASEAGFRAVWASGLEISASRGVPDASILSMPEYLAAATEIAEAADVPVLADCDSGFGNVNNVFDMVRRYERRGIAGVCIEDKAFPKLNSFAGGDQLLVSIPEFTAKLRAACAARNDRDFVVVARTEALISGAGQGEAVARAHAYERAGATALLIHSKRPDPSEVYEFRERYRGGLPLLVVPTTYAQVRTDELERRGIAAVIYANHGIRSSISAMRSVFERILSDGTTAGIEGQIATLKQVFSLQRLDELLDQRRRYERADDPLGG